MIPEFTKKLANQTAPVGESVKFAVEFTGKPKRVQWFLKDTEILPDSKFQVNLVKLEKINLFYIYSQCLNNK